MDFGDSGTIAYRGVRNAETKMTVTGIPPYVVLCSQIHELERGVDSHLESVVEEIWSVPNAVNQHR